MSVQSLSSAFLMQLRVELDSPLILPDLPLGTRRILYAKGGSFSGSEFEGEVLPGGGDWVLQRHDGVAELDIRFVLRTVDAHLIYMRSSGIFDISPLVRERIQNGGIVASSEYYFRTSLTFETGAEKYKRLNRIVGLGIGQRTKMGMVTDVFEFK